MESFQRLNFRVIAVGDSFNEPCISKVVFSFMFAHFLTDMHEP